MNSFARPGQPLIEHLHGVATRTEAFADIFNNGDWGHWLGMLHDLGKFNPAWQRYLNSSNGDNIGEDDDKNTSAPHPKHSAAGAIYADDKFPKILSTGTFAITSYDIRFFVE